ncbi:MAG: alpha-L-fucosidase [Candidatus Atribacteria bacterium]|nr:alpha-L-fucosidase [Candidatus Atribacteria bacterium]MCD6350050.1 alpha-L-fucosidase [Candidatus Atribacteria bacterium]
MSSLPFRQVHLDFHTSPFIPDVAQDFDPEEFAETLSEARINSINIFARCHHGYCYYPTRVGKTHPSLKRDLLGEMIEALHRKGIRCPVYTSVVWDELSASQHPDWRQVDFQGKLIGRAPLENKGWQFLCMNSPYMDYLEEHVKELIELYGQEIDGLWFDIIIQHPDGCFCPHCQKSMREKNLRPDCKEDRLQHNLLVERKAMQRLSQIVKSRLPEALVVFNCRVRLDRRVEKGIREELAYASHLEIESLPSGIWGYLHFPMYVRYFAPLDKEIVGMTGRFHLAWGDFGGLKNQAALEYECNRIIALGAKCSVGDQLHPRGKLDGITYEKIGRVYREIEKKEPFCEGAKLKAEIGVLVNSITEGAALGFSRSFGLEADEGATRMLMELHQQFHLIDEESDFDSYRVIIAPDGVPFSSSLRAKISRFLERGGALLLTHRSGLDPESGNFAVPTFELDYLGDLEFDTDYFRPDIEKVEDLSPEYDYVLYSKGSRVVAREGEVLAYLVHPYFNRDWEKFCSHRQTPPYRKSSDPFWIKKGNIVYISHPLFTLYRKYAYLPYKLIIKHSLQILLPEPQLVVENAPSSCEVTLLEQEREGRDVIHLLFYVPERRGKIDIVEDAVPLRGVLLKYRTPKKPQRVYLAPCGEELAFQWQDNYAVFSVPEFRGHQMVVVEK